MIKLIHTFINWVGTNKNAIIRNSFLLPILLVVIMSISHVVSWYDLGNPLSWAIYLSIAVEVFALATVAAATIRIGKGSIWFLFGMVTLIQMIGNIYFGYKEILITSESFLSWVELIHPLFEDWSITDHRRFLAAIQGGTLPIMSLTALHFYIKFSENIIEEKKKSNKQIKEAPVQERVEDIEVEQPSPSKELIETIKESKKKFAVNNYGDDDWATPIKEELPIIDIKTNEELDIEKIKMSDIYELALNYWSQTKGPYEGISEKRILDHYNDYQESLSSNRNKGHRKSSEKKESDRINKTKK